MNDTKDRCGIYRPSESWRGKGWVAVAYEQLEADGRKQFWRHWNPPSEKKEVTHGFVQDRQPSDCDPPVEKKVVTQCPHCGARFRIDRRHLGRDAKCKCRKRFALRAASSSSAPNVTARRVAPRLCPTCGGRMRVIFVEDTPVSRFFCTRCQPVDSTCPYCGSELSRHGDESCGMCLATWPEREDIYETRPESRKITSDSEMCAVLRMLCDAYSANQRGTIDDLEPIATQIGETLYERGRITEMLRIFEMIGSRPGRRTLEMHWGGIGSWCG